MKTDTTHLLTQATAQLPSSTTITQLLNEGPKIMSDYNQPSSSNILRKQTSSLVTVQDRYLNDLNKLRQTDTTYLEDPKITDNDKDNEFSEWVKIFDVDSYKSIISDLLIENNEMRLLFSQLVPSQVTNIQFWSRYFYKVNILEEDHKKRLKLIERAVKETSNDASANDQNELTWEDENGN
jgi:hypothetical protein